MPQAWAGTRSLAVCAAACVLLFVAAGDSFRDVEPVEMWGEGEIKMGAGRLGSSSAAFSGLRIISDLAGKMSDADDRARFKHARSNFISAYSELGALEGAGKLKSSNQRVWSKGDRSEDEMWRELESNSRDEGASLLRQGVSRGDRFASFPISALKRLSGSQKVLTQRGNLFTSVPVQRRALEQLAEPPSSQKVRMHGQTSHRTFNAARESHTRQDLYEPPVYHTREIFHDSRRFSSAHLDKFDRIGLATPPGLQAHSSPRELNRFTSSYVQRSEERQRALRDEDLQTHQNGLRQIESVHVPSDMRLVKPP